MEMTAELTRLEQIILDAIRTQKEPIDRNAIAGLIGRKQLNPYDKLVLVKLAEMGLIEVIQKPIGIARIQHFYKAL